MSLVLPEVRPGELRRNAAVGALVEGTRLPRGDRRLLGLALRLEGGAMSSYSARAYLSSRLQVNIGSYSYGSIFTPGSLPSGTTIGRYVSVGPGVLAFGANHPVDSVSLHPYWYNAALKVVREGDVHRVAPRIEHEAWLGARTVLLPGCRRVGIGAVIGAGSVVTKDVPDFAIVAGNPARLIRYRFDKQVITQLMRLAWWQLPLSAARGLLPELRETLSDHSFARLCEKLQRPGVDGDLAC